MNLTVKASPLCFGVTRSELNRKRCVKFKKNRFSKLSLLSVKRMLKCEEISFLKIMRQEVNWNNISPKY